jgi:autotransporter translocation and assembly factor TamB
VQADLSAPDANLADFNDYFNSGDTLSGNGRLQLSVDTSRQAFLSSGNIDLGGVRYRRLEIGSTVANWRTQGRTLALRGDVGGASGRAHVTGTATLPSYFGSLSDIATGTQTNLAAYVREVNLATWLPMLGYTTPVTGYLNADATARGRFPDVTLSATAGVRDGTVGRIHLQQAHVALEAQRGRGTIRQAIVQIPYLTAQGSGAFGLHARDPLQLAVHATSPDLGKLVNSVTGKDFDGSGALDTTLHISGTRVEPQLRDDFTLSDLRYAKFSVPRIFGTAVGDLHEVTLERGEVDLRRGSILASGQVPLHPPRNAPVNFNLDVRNVDFSDFTSALPQGYRLAGTMGGRMSVRGTMDAPQLDGSIALSNGYFVGPIDQNPVQKINGTIAFSGTTVAIQALHADVGGGTFTMNGTASVPNFRDIKAATFDSTMVADGAQFNSPKYFRGKINANVRAYRQTGGMITLAGNVNVPTARIPLSAFWNPHAPKKTPGPPLPVAFNLTASAGDDVRVQSTGVDVGAKGSVTVGGDLAHPTLSGVASSTGGTIDFIRRFTIQSGNVNFSPANGIMPYVNAVATTQVANPPTYIALHVTGLAPNNMQIAFTSDPSYDRAQIIGLLSGLASPSATGGGMMAFNGTSELQNLALGQINTYFTQSLLEPLSASLGEALGLQNLQLTDDFTSGFGFSAAKAFGKHITATFSQSLGFPQRQSLSIEAHRGNSTAFNLSFYQTTSPSLLTNTNSTNLFGFNDMANSTALTQMLGNNGFTMTYEHKF